MRISYKDYSLDSYLESQGAQPGKTIDIEKSEARAVAPAVLTDIEKGKTNHGTDSTQYQFFQEYVVKNEKGETQKDDKGNIIRKGQKVDYNSGDEQYDDTKASAEESIKVKDDDGTTYKASDAKEQDEEDTDTALTLTLSGLGSATAAIAGVVAAINDKVLGTVESTTKISDKPVWGPLTAGAIILAAGYYLKKCADDFDKADLKRREMFAAAVEQFNQNAVDKQGEIDTWCKETTAERQNEMLEYGDNAAEKTENMLDKIAELDKQYEKDMKSTTNMEELAQIKDAYYAEREELMANNGTKDDIAGMSEVMELGFDGLYEKFAECDGLSNGYNIIKKYLNQGKGAASAASTARVLSYIAAGLNTVASAGMVVSVVNAGFWNSIPAAIAAAIGIAAAAYGTVLNYQAADIFNSKAHREAKCNAAGDELNAKDGALTILEDAVTSKDGYGDDLINALSTTYTATEANTQSVIEKCENGATGEGNTNEDGEVVEGVHITQENTSFETIFDAPPGNENE